MLGFLRFELLCFIFVHPAAAPVLENNSAPRSRIYTHRYTAFLNDVLWLLTDAQRFPATTCRGAAPCSSTTIYCWIMWLLTGAQLRVPIKCQRHDHWSSQWRNYMLKHSRGAAAHFYEKHNIRCGVFVSFLLLSKLNKLPWLGEVPYPTHFKAASNKHTYFCSETFLVWYKTQRGKISGNQ